MKLVTAIIKPFKLDDAREAYVISNDLIKKMPSDERAVDYSGAGSCSTESA